MTTPDTQHKEGRTKHTIIGIVMFIFFAWAFYNFILGDEGRAFVDNAVELPTTRVNIPKSKDKPICSQIIVPAGDCIPQHIANLPPDPGPAGMLTIEGIDSNKNGVRDDAEILIVQKWGHSERAVQALFLIAKDAQMMVKYGGDISGDEAFELAKKIGPTSKCYIATAGEDVIADRAAERVTGKIRNTPERFERYRKFDASLHMRLFEMQDMSLQAACGYDPEALPN